MPASNLDLNYPPEYIEACFYAWYRSGAPSLKVADNRPSAGATKVLRALDPAPNGNRPNLATMGRWMENYGWRERADALDAQVAMKMDRSVVQERIEILQRLSKAGKKLMDKGLKHIENSENPFADNPSAAVRAIIAGAEMEFKYSGAANKLEAIQDMSDKQLERAIMGMLGTESNDENKDETVEATLEDVLSEDDIPAEDDNS